MALKLTGPPLTIRQQLIVGVALVHAVLMTIFVVDLVVRQRAFLHDEQVQRSASLVQGIARQVAVGLLAGDLAAVQEVIDGFREYPELHYAIVTDPAGRVMAHSDGQHVGAYLSDGVSQDMLGGPRQLRTLVDSARALDLAMPVLSDGRLIGWVRFAAGRNAAELSLQGVAGKGALYALVAILIGSVLAWWMGSAMTRRLQELLEVADRERSLLEANTVLEARVAQRTGELADSEATLRSILEHANDAFIQMDEQGRVTGWNDMAQTTFGWTPAQALGRPLAELIIPPAQREAHRHGLARYLATGEARALIDRRVETVGCTRDGREIKIEVSLRVRRLGQGGEGGGGGGGKGACFFDAFLRDITERKRLEAALELLAATDALTGLPNRRSLMQSLPLAMKRAERSGRPLALIFLDLDRFKEVNDCHGHEAGDRVLIEFGRRLQSLVRGTDTAARLAGDEFVVILEGLISVPADAAKVADKILACSQLPFDLGNGQSALLSASIGLSICGPDDHMDPERLLSRGDEAMYSSKHHGKSRVSTWGEL